MEDQEPTPSNTPPPAARTAQALRELHDRARTALAAQRERMGQLEAQLTHQLDTIADTLAEQIASHSGPAGEAQQTLNDVAQLRRELEQTRLEWNIEREAWQAERAELVAADSERAQSLDQQQADIQVRQQTLDDRAAGLNHQDRELRQRQELLDSEASLVAEQQSQLTATESALESQRTAITERELALQNSQVDLEQVRTDLTTREQAIQTEQSSLAAEREALQAERAATAQEATALAANKQLNESETVARLASLEHQLATERTAWDRERASVEEQRRLLAKERDDLVKALEAARGELTTARAEAAAAGELEARQQELDAEREEVARLTARVAELEQEIRDRPEVDETDSVELVHLRAERDTMAERITALEEQLAAQQAAPQDADASEEQSDLERRFELAMEDVHELKAKNAELESQLASAKKHGLPAASSSTDGGGSWEAMKRKMLANLEGEGDDVDEDRQEERAQIEDTIRATDEALARKDKELAELKSRLAEAAHAPPDRNAVVEELIDADEIIAGHRARIAQLEKEMTDKLRAAELELSVERAKITRESAHLAGLKADMESLRASGVDPHAAPGTSQQPKRRWLSKLGLNGDDDEGK